MPGKLTKEEEQHLFDKAMKFSAGATAKQENYPPEFAQHKTTFGTEEEIRNNLKNPILIKRHLMAKEIAEREERRGQILTALRNRYGTPKHNAEHRLDRAIVAMMKTGGTPEDKQYNEQLYLKYIDPEGSKLLYQEHVEKLRNFDYSKLNDVKTPEDAMKFYDENCDVLTGSFSPEFYFAGGIYTPEFTAQINQCKNLMTVMMNSRSIVQYYKTPAMFAVPDVSKIGVQQSGVMQAFITFKGENKENRAEAAEMNDMVHSLTASAQWYTMPPMIAAYQEKGGSLTPGGLFKDSIVDSKGNPGRLKDGFAEQKDMKVIPNDPEKQSKIDQIFSQEYLAELESYNTPESEEARNARYEAKRQSILDEERKEADKNVMLPQYAEKHKEYMTHNRFARWFMFGKRREIRAMERTLRENGASDLEMRLARHDNKLDPARADEYKQDILKRLHKVVAQRKEEVSMDEKDRRLGVCHKELQKIAKDVHLLNGAEIPEKENREQEKADLIAEFHKEASAASMKEIAEYEFGKNSENMKSYFAEENAPAEKPKDEPEPMSEINPEFVEEVSTEKTTEPVNAETDANKVQETALEAET